MPRDYDEDLEQRPLPRRRRRAEALSRWKGEDEDSGYRPLGPDYSSMDPESPHHRGAPRERERERATFATFAPELRRALARRPRSSTHDYR